VNPVSEQQTEHLLLMAPQRISTESRVIVGAVSRHSSALVSRPNSPVRPTKLRLYIPDADVHACPLRRAHIPVFSAGTRTSSRTTISTRTICSRRQMILGVIRSSSERRPTTYVYIRPNSIVCVAWCATDSAQQSVHRPTDDYDV
jgi:hypothetical protein